MGGTWGAPIELFLRYGKLLAHVVASSMDEHARFGGVVTRPPGSSVCPTPAAPPSTGPRAKAVAFPRPLTRPGDDPYAFSFSGLKTAAARWVEKHHLRGEELPVADGAAALQEAVADVLSRKALAACRARTT